MAQQRINKEVVRLLVLQHGQKVASQLSEVPYETVRKWTQRGNWLASHNVPKPLATIVADKLSEEIEVNGKQTKLSLSRSARKMAQQSERADLEEAPLVRQVAQTAALVHGWEAKGEGSTNVAVNIAILDSAPIT